MQIQGARKAATYGSYLPRLSLAWSKRYKLTSTLHCPESGLRFICINSDVTVHISRVYRLLRNATAGPFSSHTAGGSREREAGQLERALHIASQEEAQQVVRREGSFTEEHIETLVLEARGESAAEEDAWTRGKKRAKNIRSFTGSIIQHHLGEGVIDRLYNEKLAKPDRGRLQ